MNMSILLTLVVIILIANLCIISACMYNNWTLVEHFQYADQIPVKKFRSDRTGLTLVLIEDESPITEGRFCLATETNSNDGLPHALEHILFMGSKHYPYVNILDKLAARCLAPIAGANTYKDKTCYNIKTVGPDGFLNILPIFLDHIFNPVMKQEDFITEIHHIDGQGLDSGVMYNEMVASLAIHERLMLSEGYLALYPRLDGKPSSYSWNYGGNPENLRNSIDIDKIREYHNQYYRPENLFLIVTGQMEPEEIFQRLDSVEQELLEHRQDDNSFKRPFSTTYLPLSERIERIILIPRDDETVGDVGFAWRLPLCLVENELEMAAVGVIKDYLQLSEASVLSKTFITIAHPLTSSIKIVVDRIAQPNFHMIMYNVPVDQMERVEQLLDKTLENHSKKSFDEKRIKSLIKASRDKFMVNLFESGIDEIKQFSEEDMVYGHGNKSLQVLSTSHIEKLLKKPRKFWLCLMRRIFSRPKVFIKAKPSRIYKNQIEDQELQRLALQKKHLGVEGLKKKAENLKRAMDKPSAPPEVLRSVPFGNIDKINYRKITLCDSVTICPDEFGFQLDSSIFPIHINSLETRKVRMSMFFDTARIPGLKSHDIPYIVFLAEMLLRNKVKVDGVLKNIPEVTAENFLALPNAGLGFGSNSYLLYVHASTSFEKYQKGYQAFKNILFDIQFDASVILNQINEIRIEYPKIKADSNRIVATLQNGLLFVDDVRKSFNFIQRYNFAKHLAQEMKQNPEKIVQKLSKLYSDIVSPEIATLIISTDFQRLAKVQENSSVIEMWKDMFDNMTITKPFTQPELPVRDRDLINIDSNRRHALAGVPGSRTSMIRQAITLNISNYSHPDLAGLAVIAAYLNTNEFLDKIRGEGLAYITVLNVDINKGTIEFISSQSVKPVRTFELFREILELHLNGIEAWNEDLFQSAKGTVIYDLASNEKSIPLTVSTLKLNILSGSDLLYYRELIREVYNVKLQDAVELFSKYFQDFLFSEKTVTSITSPNYETETIRQDFSTKWGIELNVIDDLETSFLVQSTSFSETS